MLGSNACPRWCGQEWLDCEDFLQQCVPRLARLIEAGTLDLLPSELLERCLSVNDDLCRVLAGQPLAEVCCALVPAWGALLAHRRTSCVNPGCRQ